MYIVHKLNVPTFVLYMHASMLHTCIHVVPYTHSSIYIHSIYTNSILLYYMNMEAGISQYKIHIGYKHAQNYTCTLSKHAVET